jgi:hypothetical protein
MSILPSSLIGHHPESMPLHIGCMSTSHRLVGRAPPYSIMEKSSGRDSHRDATNRGRRGPAPEEKYSFLDQSDPSSHYYLHETVLPALQNPNSPTRDLPPNWDPGFYVAIMVLLPCGTCEAAPDSSPACGALSSGATSTITSGALHSEVYNLLTNISSFFDVRQYLSRTITPGYGFRFELSSSINSKY